jgi:hypothetical protein
MSFVAMLLPTLKDICMGMLLKIAFKPILERFITRLVIAGLKSLAKMSTNDVVDSTIADIINSLNGKKLKVISDIKAGTL